MRTALRAAVSLCLAGWLLTRVDAGSLLPVLEAIPPSFWIAALAFHLLSQAASAARWAVISRALGFRGPLATFLAYYFTGMFFNLFLPSGIGGDVVKAVLMGKDSEKKTAAAMSVLLDRLSGLLAMFMMGAIAALISPASAKTPLRPILLASGAMSLGVLILTPALHAVTRTTLPTLHERMAPLVTLWKEPRLLAGATALSILLQIAGTGVLPILASGMGMDLPILVYYAIFPFIAVMTVLPISLNGIGVREGGFVAFLSLYGVPSEKSLALSLGFFGAHLAAGLMGGILYGTGFCKRTPPITASALP